MTEETPKFDRAAVLERTPEEIQADLDAQTEAALKLSHLVPETVAVAYYRAAVGQPKTVDSLFWQGRFEEAADLAIGQNKKDYLEFADALVTLDMPMCDCPPIQFASKESAKGVSVPSKREIQSVFVANLKKEIRFIRCDGCGKLFAQSA